MHDCEIMAKSCFYGSLHGFQVRFYYKYKWKSNTVRLLNGNCSAIGIKIIQKFGCFFVYFPMVLSLSSLIATQRFFFELCLAFYFLSRVIMALSCVIYSSFNDPNLPSIGLPFSQFWRDSSDLSGLAPPILAAFPPEIQNRFHVQTPFFLVFAISIVFRDENYEINLRQIQSEDFFFREHFFLGTNIMKSDTYPK